MKIKMNKNLGRRKYIVVDILSIEEKILPAVWNMSSSLRPCFHVDLVLVLAIATGFSWCEGVSFIVVSC
jgi:hypothetical protein